MSYKQYPNSPSSTPASPPPTLPSTNSPSSNQKADQIVHRLFTKLVNVVADARISPFANYASQSASPYDTDEASQVSGLASTSRNSSAAPLSSGRNDRTQRKDPKSDKWFNLETSDFDQFKTDLSAFKNVSGVNPIPPLHVNVLLSIPPNSTPTGGTHHGPTATKVLVHHFTPPRASSPTRGQSTSNTRVTRVSPQPRYILLETHTLSFSGENMLSSGSVELPQVYKQAISLFRSIYTLLRILPSWKLQRQLRRNRGSSSSANLSIDVRLSVGTPLELDEDVVAGFDAPLSQPAASLIPESIAFPPITTPLGSFTLRTVYRSHPNYALESLESLLSHHFLSPSPSSSEYQQREAASSSNAPAARREPTQFTPTITSALERQRRESLESSPRSPLPSAPLPLPVPERAKPFPIPSDLELSSNQAGYSSHVGSAPISMPMRKQLSNVANASPSSSVSSSPRPRRISALGSVSSQSVDFPGPSALGLASASNSSPRFGFLHGRDPADLPFAVGLGSGRTSGVMERTRKESLLGSSVAGERPVASSSHGRRPSINSIHPFKSATVSSSPSSASFRGPSTVQPPPSSSSPFVHSANPSTTSFPSVSEPRTSGDRPSGAQPPAGLAVPQVPRSPDRLSLQLSSTRYSSSFGNRPSSLVTAGALGEATGIGRARQLGQPDSLRRDSPTRHSASASNEFLSAQSEDDDISAFVKAIDSRAPLRGGLNTGGNEQRGSLDFPTFDETSQTNSPRQRHGTLSTPPSPLISSPLPGDDRQTSASGNPSMIADVDETLRRMTESFRAGYGVLEGGLRSRRLRTESAAPAVGMERTGAGNRTSPLIEEDAISTGSGSGSPGGRRIARTLSNNLSSSSLLAGGRRSYDSAEQIVGRMDLTEEEDARRSSPSSRRSDAVPRRTRRMDSFEDAAYAQAPTRF